jgi:hypothetical protein
MAALLSLTVHSCTDYGSEFTDAGFKAQSHEYDGTIYEYLSEGDAGLGLRFDSVLMVIDGIPGRKEMLSEPGAEYTFFAAPDECFRATINNLNRVRDVASKSRMTFADLLIEPFTVVDTIIREIDISGVTYYDTTYNFRHYDYRKQLDSILCRYIFDGLYSFDTIAANPRGVEPECYNYKLKMNIESFRQTSSGVINSGQKRIIYSDMNESKLTSDWLRSATLNIDIKTKNGIIHVLSTGHEFSFDDFIYRFKNYGNEYIKQE